MDAIEKKLLHEVAELDALPVGAYNIRANGQLQTRNTTANIDIVSKDDKPGIDIYIKPGTKNESVHIPVIISQTGLTDLVYNDFHIGEGADVTIIAGCGIHNCGGGNAQHDGIHTFYVEKNARVRYRRQRLRRRRRPRQAPRTPPPSSISEGCAAGMERPRSPASTTPSARPAPRRGRASRKDPEKDQTPDRFAVTRRLPHRRLRQVARAAACRVPQLINGCACAGHSECDAIIMDDAKVIATPGLIANNVDASLIHEAAIGKIAGEQLIKLMTLGLTEQEAEEQIVNGFLE